MSLNKKEVGARLVRKALSALEIAALVFQASCARPAPTVSPTPRISIPPAGLVTPPVVSLTETAPGAMDVNKVFSKDQLTAFSQYGLSFNANGNLIQKFKDVTGKEQTITVGHLEKDSLHISDYGTGIESIINPKSIVNFHQDINELFPDILKGNDSKDANVVWAYNPEHGWFKQIKDGETVDAVAFTDGRINISERLDSDQIEALFPADAVSSEFFFKYLLSQR